MNEQGEIILYQPNEELKLDVRVEDETVWLSQAQIVNLFASSKANVSEHLKSIFSSGELKRDSTVRKFRTVRLEGNRQVVRNIEYFNLDVIISIGYRVNTIRGIQFRQSGRIRCSGSICCADIPSISVSTTSSAKSTLGWWSMTRSCSS